MAKKVEDIVELTKILKKIRADAKSVARDLTLGIRAINTLGICYLGMGVLLGAITVILVFRGDWVVVPISVFFAAFGIFSGWWTVRFYHRMRKRYSGLFKLIEE
jgi:hypothetical protein